MTVYIWYDVINDHIVEITNWMEQKAMEGDLITGLFAAAHRFVYLGEL